MAIERIGRTRDIQRVSDLEGMHLELHARGDEARLFVAAVRQYARGIQQDAISAEPALFGVYQTAALLKGAADKYEARWADTDDEGDAA